jgi:hypothetical protein
MEGRMEGRFTGLEVRVDGIDVTLVEIKTSVQQLAQDTRNHFRDAAVETRNNFRDAAQETQNNFRDAAVENSNVHRAARDETRNLIHGLRSTIIITAISTFFAVVFGMAALNATILSNMLAAFESGKNTSAAQAEVKRQLEQSALLLQQMQQRFERGAPK